MPACYQRHFVFIVLLYVSSLLIAFHTNVQALLYSNATVGKEQIHHRGSSFQVEPRMLQQLRGSGPVTRVRCEALLEEIDELASLRLGKGHVLKTLVQRHQGVVVTLLVINKRSCEVEPRVDSRALTYRLPSRTRLSVSICSETRGYTSVQTSPPCVQDKSRNRTNIFEIA